MNRLFVFTTQRGVREFESKFSDELVPKAFSLGEFWQRVSYVKGLAEADASQLLLLMRKACAMSEAAKERLKIPTEFFAFLKNNDYLFSFFRELATQKKSVDDLKFSDIYASFEEHIEILGEVLANYKRLLKEHGLYDNITFCELYEINEEYVRSWDEINIEAFGFLSEHEWEMLCSCAALTTVKIKFQTSKFNKKLTSKIASIINLEANELALNYHYELNLSEKRLTKLENVAQNKLVLTRPFALRALQAAYIFEKISFFVREGISPEKIAVILPDESFAGELRLYDEKNMLSYAMGASFEDTGIYNLLLSMSEAVKQDINPFLGDDALKQRDLSAMQTILNFYSLPNELFLKFKNLYETQVKFELFEEIISQIFELAPQEKVREILREELFFVGKLAVGEGLKFGELVQILLMRLGSRSIDEAHGGLVRCIGLLESRGLKFDGVIIADFNDDIVPKRSVNEMFLSSAVREKAGLISYVERENLQRFYYENLINGAKRVAVSYVQNESENKIRSRFLSEFKCVEDNSFSDGDYLGAFSSGTGAKFHKQSLKFRHDFFEKKLSFTRLDTFLTCPRRYFYRYILGLREGRNFGGVSASEYGKRIHEALFECYSRFKEFRLNEFLQILEGKNLNPLELEIARIKFEEFAENERVWVERGWQNIEQEAEKEVNFEGVNIVGIVDRIDAKEGELCVIDYKTGSKFSTLQLAFYKALLGGKGDVQAYFCDLKERMGMVYDKTGELEELREGIAKAREYFTSEASFEPNISAACQTCAYYAICRGELR